MRCILLKKENECFFETVFYNNKEYKVSLKFSNEDNTEEIMYIANKILRQSVKN